jgi:hypothetical protein
MTLIVTPRNKQQEKVIKAFLGSLNIAYHTEQEEDIALHRAMEEGRNTPLLNARQKEAFLKKLKKAK